MSAHAAKQVLTTNYQREVAAWWDNRTTDRVNLALGEIDGFYHHHYGVGEVDPTVLECTPDTRDERIIQELHRLEHAQANLLLDHLGPVRAGDRLLDAGSGRGGVSFLANLRWGCRVDGVSISQYQVDFATEQAALRGVTDQVSFHFRNMLDTGLPAGEFSAVWTNETTMYVDLFDLYREVARLLRPGGRYVNITGCYNDLLGQKAPAVRRIDEHYHCDVHARSRYFQALAANGLVPIKVLDLSSQTLPYWELRAQSPVRTGIEESFCTAYREASFHYLLVVADRR